MQFRLSPRAFTSDLMNHLHARPVIPINARTLRITAAAGLRLAGASSVANVKNAAINDTPFLTAESTLQPEGLLHTRGMAASELSPFVQYSPLPPAKSGPCLSSSVADHPLEDQLRDRRLGEPRGYTSPTG